MENLSPQDYEKLLKLISPWRVSKVEFKNETINIYVGYDSTTGICPECGGSCKVYDRRKARKWRHLDTMEYHTYIHCQIPRIECKDCNKILSISVPWSESYNGFTFKFEDHVVEQLLTSRSIEETRKFLSLTWRQVSSIKRRAVERGLSRRGCKSIINIGIDEKSFLKGHNYVSLLNDLDNSRVLEVVEGRKEEDTISLIDKGLTSDQKKGVKAVAIDMWKAYSNAVKTTVSSADIVHDYFHISKHMNEAVDKTRRSEHKKLLKKSDETLTGMKYELVRNSENLDKSLFGRFKALQARGYKTARAWAIKELFRNFWRYNSVAWARKFFNKWYSWAIRSRLHHIKKVARMLKKHLKNILNYFKHKITNAVSEGINSKIQTVKSNARGFHSFDSYRTTILFYCGKLDMLHSHTNCR